VMEALDRGDWQLVLVDNTLNLGFSSVSIADWQVRGVISIVPAYAQDDMDAFFAGIDVLVFPSQWKESFGLTVREALARDVWVIATDGGGPAEAIDDGVNGTLIPLDGRHEGLQQAIEAVLDRPQAVRSRNPHAGDIMDYASQAEWLRTRLARVAGYDLGQYQPGWNRLTDEAFPNVDKTAYQNKQLGRPLDMAGNIPTPEPL